MTRTQASVRGPILLLHREAPPRFTVIRSPHKDKDLQRALRDADPKRLIDIIEPTLKTVDLLQRLDLPAGVDIEIKDPERPTPSPPPNL